MRALAQEPMDPWLRTALLENSLHLSSMLGDLPPALLRCALEKPLCSSSSLLWLSDKARESGDGAFAGKLCARAMSIDPSRPCMLK